MGRREVRGVGNENLHGGGADADDERGQQEDGGVAGERGGHERCAADGEGGENEAPGFKEVTEGDDEEQAEAVANLGEGDDEAGGGGADAEGVTDGPGKGLRVIDVGDDETAGDREQREQGGGDGPLRLKLRGLA